MAGIADTDPDRLTRESCRQVLARAAALDPAADAFLKRERGTWIWREPGPDGRSRVVKLYRHRGLHNALRSRATRFRAQREYSRLRHLARRGVPCTEPLGWTHGYARDHGFFEALITLEIPDAVPLGEYLASHGGGGALAPLFRLVRRMHDSGLCSQTLYARNILVRPAAPPEQRFFLSDMPRSWLFPGSITGTSMAWCDLLDLTRTIKLAGISPGEIPVEAYTETDDEARRGPRLATLRHSTHVFGKWSRKRRDIRTRLRWLAAWLPHPRRGAQPPGAPPGDESER